MSNLQKNNILNMNRNEKLKGQVVDKE